MEYFESRYRHLNVYILALGTGVIKFISIYVTFRAKQR